MGALKVEAEGRTYEVSYVNEYMTLEFGGEETRHISGPHLHIRRRGEPVDLSRGI